MQMYPQSNKINQPLETCVINNMVSLISSSSNVLYCQLYFDNFLTSYHVIELAEKVCEPQEPYDKTEGANKQLVQSKEL